MRSVFSSLRQATLISGIALILFPGVTIFKQYFGQDAPAAYLPNGADASSISATLTPVGSGPFTAAQERTDSFGIKQVYVPSGCFKMGTDPSKDLYAHNNELAQHQVCITIGYWLDEFDVTNAAFDAFVQAGGYSNDSLWSKDGLNWKQSNQIIGPNTICTPYSSQPNQPRVSVSYYESEAYANWRGGRLTTEAEWEYAARGPNSWIYPWGDTFDQNKANVYKSSIGPTTDVDAYPSGKSWVGAYDMAGNVWQWVSDWYDSRGYARKSQNDPTGPEQASDRINYRVRRGGAWNSDENTARSAYRNLGPPELQDCLSGFRILTVVPGSP